MSLQALAWGVEVASRSHHPSTVASVWKGISVARNVIDQGPFRFTEIHGPRRSLDERSQVALLLRRRGLQPPRCEFALEEIPLIDLIESLIVEAHFERGLQELWDYEAWRANGAPEAELRANFAHIDESRRQETPRFTPRLLELESLYARGAAVEPLVAKERDFALSSGDKALLLFDGRHRTFAAAHAGVERLPMFVLLRADAVFSY